MKTRRSFTIWCAACAVALVLSDCNGKPEGIRCGSITCEPEMACVEGTCMRPASAYIEEILEIDRAVTAGELSEVEFLDAYQTVLSMIDREAGTVSRVREYLEEEILGYEFQGLPMNARREGLGGTARRYGDRGSSSDRERGLIERITQTTAYQMFETFFGSVILGLLPPGSGELLSIARPDVAVALSTYTVRVHIDDAFYGGDIDFETYYLLLDMLKENPFAAEKQLLIATGRPVPDLLQQVPSGCLRQCEETGTPPRTCEFQCNDSACIAAALACNGIADCSGGEDEAGCDVPRTCCQRTLGCPGETGAECAKTCCCCPENQACCADWSAGCCPTP